MKYWSSHKNGNNCMIADYSMENRKMGMSLSLKFGEWKKCTAHVERSKIILILNTVCAANIENTGSIFVTLH